MICRVGIRPSTDSELSTRLVSNFAAALGYVSCTFEYQISSYTSEPLMAFGATSLLNKVTLPTRMLPRFRELPGEGALVTRSTGGVVARVILLQAMDACILDSYLNFGGYSHKGTFCFTGQFCSVRRFLRTLVGDSPELRNEDDTEVVADDRRSEFDAWMNK